MNGFGALSSRTPTVRRGQIHSDDATLSDQARTKLMRHAWQNRRRLSPTPKNKPP